MRKRKEKRDCICEMGFVCDNPNHLSQLKRLKDNEVNDEDLTVYK